MIVENVLPFIRCETLIFMEFNPAEKHLMSPYYNKKGLITSAVRFLACILYDPEGEREKCFDQKLNARTRDFRNK